MNRKRKYGNKKVVSDGVKFDSKLEFYLHQLLSQTGIKFDFQFKRTLIPKFRFRDENVRELGMIIDFRIEHDGRIIYVDTKGFPNDVAPIKYKMLKYFEKDNPEVEILWLSNTKEVDEFVNSLKPKKNEQLEQSFIDW